MGRPVVHWEFWSEDLQEVSKFYQQVFDWKIQPIAELDYTLVETGGTSGINGGIMKPKRGLNVRGSRRPGARNVEAAEVIRGRGSERSSAGTAK
jgi:predicted enzyme related to lactoylglutathione lyase